MTLRTRTSYSASSPAVVTTSCEVSVPRTTTLARGLAAALIAVTALVLASTTGQARTGDERPAAQTADRLTDR
ncbi:hypothetical protein ACVNF4_01595 [Streptomyces sp. S6]